MHTFKNTLLMSLCSFVLFPVGINDLNKLINKSISTRSGTLIHMYEHNSSNRVNTRGCTCANVNNVCNKSIH
jgi:hypothetical protein